MKENFEYDIRVIYKVSKSPSPSQSLVFIENMGCSPKHKVKSWQRKENMVKFENVLKLMYFQILPCVVWVSFNICTVWHQGWLEEKTRCKIAFDGITQNNQLE